MKIENIKIRNFKSIRELDLSFGQINIMIGGNGVGKSNLISFFKLLSQIINRNLNLYVARSGGSNNLLYFGSKVSPEMGSEIIFRNYSAFNSYLFSLATNIDDGLYFTIETIGYGVGKIETVKYIGKGYNESLLSEYNKKDYNVYGGKKGVSYYVVKAFEGLSFSRHW